MFASALTVFRFFPGEFLSMFKALKPEEEKVVALVGNSALDYLEFLSAASLHNIKPASQFTPDPLIANVLPNYQMLRRELNK